MNIGDRVTSKRTGLPGIGIVCGMIYGYLYLNYIARHDIHLWDELYPNWNDKLVIYVTMDAPQKNMSFQEYCQNAQKYHNTQGTNPPLEEELKILYKYTVPLVSVITFPEDDLEVIEPYIKVGELHDER